MVFWTCCTWKTVLMALQERKSDSYLNNGLIFLARIQEERVAGNGSVKLALFVLLYAMGW